MAFKAEANSQIGQLDTGKYSKLIGIKSLELAKSRRYSQGVCYALKGTSRHRGEWKKFTYSRASIPWTGYFQQASAESSDELLYVQLSLWICRSDQTKMAVKLQAYLQHTKAYLEPLRIAITYVYGLWPKSMASLLLQQQEFSECLWMN